MAIPAATRTQILEALRRFDSERRNKAEWSQWTSNENFKFAVDHEGRLYPVKEIVRLATGATDFSGGSEANTFLQRYGFNVVPLRSQNGRQTSRNVWWVNQTRSFHEESLRKFLWAPLKDKNGHTPLHWATMQEVRAGDVIVSYKDKAIPAVSRALSASELSERPKELESGPWEHEGRIVKTECFIFQSPVAVEALWSRLRSLNIPDGPVQESGNSPKQGYLWRFSEDGLAVLRQASDESWPDWAEPTAEHGRSWIFQANPDIFDISRAVRQLPELTWLVRQHGSEIRAGDRAFLWESGPSGGVLATATVLTSPTRLTDDQSEVPFYRQPGQFEGTQLRVRLRVDHVLSGLVQRRTLEDDLTLATLPFLRQSAGTNLPLTNAESEALLRRK